MANTSTTGGYLVAGSPAPADDVDLNVIFQEAVVGITGLDPTLVRPRLQLIQPKRPEAPITWAAVGVHEVEPWGDPSIQHVPATYDSSGKLLTPAMDVLTEHVTLRVMVTFYGPQAERYGGILRRGIALPQNMEALSAQNIKLAHRGTLRGVGEIINELQVSRWDLDLLFNRKTTAQYPIEDALAGGVHVFDATGRVDQTLTFPTE